MLPQANLKETALCIFVFGWICAFSSCSTLRGTHQRLKVASAPEGARVILNGKEIGKTPSFVEIPRSRKGETLSLVFPDGTHTRRKLKSSYRWEDSFFSNFAWAIWGAPLGWAVDLLTEAAWEYEKLHLFREEDLNPGYQPAHSEPEESVPPGKRTISIAPPQQGYELLSDELGNQVEALTNKRFPQDTVLNYKRTQPTFNSFVYSHDKKVGQLYRDKLYFALNASHILETETVRRSDGVLVQAKLTDIYTDRTVDSFKEFIPKEELKSVQHSSLYETVSSFVSLIPNTFFFDFTSSTLNFIPDGTNPGAVYIPESQKDNSLWTLLSSFAFRNSRSPKLDELRGVFRLIPDLNFYVDRFQFNRSSGPNNLAGQGFTWTSLAIGFGPELGLESPIGYFYLDLIPSLTMNWISGSSGLSSRATLELNAELGYSIFVSQRFVIKLFGRAITGSARQWNTLLSESSGDSVSFFGVAHGIYGLSIGYYFPEARTIIKNAVF